MTGKATWAMLGLLVFSCTPFVSLAAEPPTTQDPEAVAVPAKAVTRASPKETPSTPNTPESKATGNEPSTAPIMTVTYADIQGKVFLVSSQQGQDEIPAANVRVQVRDLQTEKVLREAFTDAEGYYSLPKLEPTRYLMIVGRLKVRLEVRPEAQAITELPKVLIFILPEEITRFRD